jgi:hypothetical protein
MSDLQFNNPSAPNYDWQQDREWFNQRLANANIYNIRLERRIAQLREGLRRVETGKLTRDKLKQIAAETIRADDVERRPVRVRANHE